MNDQEISATTQQTTVKAMSGKGWFTPPTFIDPDRTRNARILNAILWATAGLLILFIGIRIASGSLAISQTHFVLGTLVLLMIGLLWVLHSGHVRTASWLLVWFGWAILSFQIWTADGISDTAYIAQLIIILVASLLLGWRVGLLFTILTIASGWVYLYAEVNQIISITETSRQDVALGLTIIYLIIALLIYLLVSSLTNALNEARESNRELQLLQHNLEEQVVDRTAVAETARRQAEAAQAQMADQVWLITGQTKLNVALRDQPDIPTLTQNVMRQLCHYLDAPMGTLYLVNKDKLMFAGGYAYPVKQPRAFKMGEGLIGQAMEEKRPLIHHPIAAHLAPIVPGFDDQPLNYIIAVPFFYGKQGIGAIELVRWQPFTPLQLEFLTDMMENIAIAFNTAQTRDHMDKLLQHSRLQATELLNQEEELRAINNELVTQAKTAKTDQKEGQS